MDYHCFRHGKDLKVQGEPLSGWGDCLTCLPDYLFEGRDDFIPNSQCRRYIHCRIFFVVPKKGL